MRTPSQALNYALARERGQQNQKEILSGNNSNWNTTVAHLSARKTRPAILPTPTPKHYPQCWRCGGSFTPNHINNCPAEVSQCNICKKPGHFAKMCRSQLPPVTKNRGQYQQRQQTQTRNVKNIIEEDNQKIEPQLEEEYGSETLDPESTMNIRELINIRELNNKTPHGEIIIQTKTQNQKHNKLVSRHGITTQFHRHNHKQKYKHMKSEEYDGYMKLNCFNNKHIPIKGQLQMELKSGSWTAKNCNILLVEHKSQNLMRRDILAKLGLTLTQQQTDKG